MQRRELTGKCASSTREVEPRRAEGVCVLFPGRERPGCILGDVDAGADDYAEMGKFVQRLEGGDESVLWSIARG